MSHTAFSDEKQERLARIPSEGRSRERIETRRLYAETAAGVNREGNSRTKYDKMV